METHEKSNSVLRILKCTKFGITESIIQGTNMLTYSSSLKPFIESLKDIGADNFVLPEKLIKYKVCCQNNFRSRSKQLFDDVELRPISSSDIECLEREIQDSDRVLAEKRKVLQSLRNDLVQLQEDVIPKSEVRLSSQTRKIEVNLANFIELNNQLNSQYNDFNQSKQKLLQILSSENKEEEEDSMYHTYDFESSLFHLLERMNTDFNVLSKFINSSTMQPGSNVDLELDIELIGKSLSNLRTQIEKTKCKQYAQERCEEKLLAVKQQLEKGVFKFNMLESSSHLKSTQQLRSDLASAWSKVSSSHASQVSLTLSPALHRLFQIRASSLETSIHLLTSMATGMNCTLSLQCLFVLLVQMERHKYERLCGLVYEAHETFDELHSSLITQQTKLKQLMIEDSSRSRESKETSAQTYASQLIAQSIRLDESGSVDQAVQSLEDKLTLEKQRIQREYCMETVYRKLAPLRQCMKDKAATIYSGPTQVPIFPYREHNELVHSRILHLSKLKVEYANLLRDIQSNGEVTNPAQSSSWRDSGIESHNNFSV